MTEIPDDIPGDVVRLARKYSMNDDVLVAVCRAILAERERCEKRNRRGPCEHVWVGKPGPKIFGFREFNCIKCGLGKQEK